MTYKTYKQIELKPYFEHGVAKLLYKEANRKELRPKEVPEKAEAVSQSGN